MIYRCMKGWIIDYQADSGPDYTFRNIIVIVAKDEDSAKELFLENYEYEDGENYLSLEFKDMVNTIIEEDPEEYHSGAGWYSSINTCDHYDNVPSNEPSYKDFYFATEDSSIKDVVVGMIDILPQINDYIKDNIGISSRYKLDDFIKSIDLDDDELSSIGWIMIPRVSSDLVLKSLRKAGII